MITISMVLSLLYGCDHSDKWSNIYIDCNEEVTYNNAFDSIFQFKSYVILEDSVDTKISNISKIRITDKKIIILDNNKRILFFDNHGHFIYSIDKLGHAKDEYMVIQDFDIRNDSLFIIDRIASQLLVYSIDGRFLTREHILPSKGLHLFESGMAFYHEFGIADGKDSEHYCYTFCSNNIKEHFLRFHKSLIGYSYSFSFGGNCFYTFDGETYFFVPFDDTIYKIDRRTGEPVPTIVYSLGERKIVPDSKDSEVKTIINSPSVVKNIFSFYKFKELICFSYYGSDDVRKYVLYDTKKGILHNASIGFDANKLPVSMLSFDNYMGEDDILLSSVSPDVIRTLSNKYGDINEFPVLKRIAKDVASNENPILIFYEKK